MPRVLVLGGTTEASLLAEALAHAGVDAVFSYAGRVASPRPQPLPVRVGGFGGVSGLRDWLAAERITRVIDATHPFAAQMSAHAVQACAALGLPLLAFERPPWTAQPGDRWRHVPDIDGAVAALPGPEAPARVFLAIGRQHVEAFLKGAPHSAHWYLLRLVDPAPDLALPRGEIVLARGPFTVEGDMALMAAHGITHVVAKNAGGQGAAAKLAAARALGLPVVLVDRPPLPPRATADSIGEVLAWLGVHAAERGV